MTLKKDVTNDDEESRRGDDDTSSGTSSNDEKDSESGGKGRSIEMTVALGDFDSNPIMPLLLASNDALDGEENEAVKLLEKI